MEPASRNRLHQPHHVHRQRGCCAGHEGSSQRRSHAFRCVEILPVARPRERIAEATAGFSTCFIDQDPVTRHEQRARIVTQDLALTSQAVVQPFVILVGKHHDLVRGGRSQTPDHVPGDAGLWVRDVRPVGQDEIDRDRRRSRDVPQDVSRPIPRRVVDDDQDCRQKITSKDGLALLAQKALAVMSDHQRCRIGCDLHVEPTPLCQGAVTTCFGRRQSTSICSGAATCAA